MRDFKKIAFWERSVDFALTVYRKTQSFPKEEMYGLTSQMRRAATSIPINIAEGCGRESKKDFMHFLQIAEGSASEVECILILAKRLNYLSEDESDALSEEIGQIKKMIRSFKIKLENDL